MAPKIFTSWALNDLYKNEQHFITHKDHKYAEFSFETRFEGLLPQTTRQQPVNSTNHGPKVHY